MRRFLFALITIVSSLGSFAKDKVGVSYEPSWLFSPKVDTSKKVNLKNVNDGYYFELYDSQLSLVHNTEYIHYVRHIVNETGVQNGSEVSVTYLPEYQSVVFHKIYVIRNGQVINQLKMNNIKVVSDESGNDEFIYDGAKRAFLILNDIRKNDRIEVSYSLVGFNPIYANRYSGTLSFSSYNPVVNYYETIITEPGRKLNFTYYNDATRPTEQDLRGLHVYHWNNPVTKIYEYKEGAPAWFSNYPYIMVSEYGSWMEVASWANTLFNNYNYRLPRQLQNRIDEWRKKASNDKDEFARLALRFVQDEIRYVGLEIGVHSYKPHDPADVFAKGYGDCKDKALLLVMILKQQDISSYVTLVNSRKRAELYKAAPAANQFDHAIVAIERENGLLYVDPTMSMQKGELSDNYISDYGYVLVIRDKETNLRRMTPGDINSIYIVETMKIGRNDTSSLSVYSLYKGGKAENTRGDFAQTSLNNLKESYVNYYKPLYDDIVMEGDMLYEDDSIVNSVLIKEEYKIPNIWKLRDKKKAFGVYAKAVQQEMGSEPPSTGEYPIALRYPVSIQYTLNLEMPDGWDFPEKSVHFNTESYKFDFESEIVGNEIKLTYYYKTFKDHVPVEDLKQYREDYKKMYDVMQYELYYTDMSKVVDKSGDNISWTAIWITAIGFFIMSLLLAALNRKTVEVDYDRDSGLKIGGWMVVLGISLCLSLLLHFISLFYGDYYKQTTWMALHESGNGLYVVGMVEMIFEVIRLSLSVSIVIWFFKRRDIFPTMFLYYVGILFAMQLVMYLQYNFVDIPKSYGNIRSEALTRLFQTAVYGVIWCTYVLRAYRTKATFLKAA